MTGATFAQFRYLDGTRAGDTRIIAADFATIGRHPTSDLCFDGERDLEVSVRHAAVFKQGGAYMVRDLASTNGTFVNGQRVRGDRPLEPNDVLQLGTGGPRLEFSITKDPPGLGTRPSALGPRHSSPLGGTGGVAERTRDPGRTTERIQREVTRQTRPWKWGVGVALALAVGAVTLLMWQQRRSRRELEAERDQILARADALLARFERSQTTNRELGAALGSARAEVRALRSNITTGELSAVRLDTLTRALAQQLTRHEDVLRLAAVDPADVAATSGGAVTVVITEFPNGRVVSGTGFAVETRRDSIWVATARHLVLDPLGRYPTRIALIFNGTGQAFRAVLVRAHESADVALLATAIRGGAPVVKGLKDSARAGDAVVMIGFPFGMDSLGNWRVTGADATASVGTIAEVEDGVLRVDGYGTHGSSGSPLFTATGEVTGLVSGGSTRGGARLVAVSVAAVRELLNPM